MKSKALMTKTKNITKARKEENTKKKFYEMSKTEGSIKKTTQ